MCLVPQHWPLTDGEGSRRCHVSLTTKKQKLCEVAQGGRAQEHVRSQSPTIRPGPRPQQETASTPRTIPAPLTSGAHSWAMQSGAPGPQPWLLGGDVGHVAWELRAPPPVSRGHGERILRENHGRA